MTNRIQEWRKKAGITQQKLAEKMGVNIDSVRRWEAGIRSPKLIDAKKMADIFNCTLDDLICKEG